MPFQDGRNHETGVREQLGGDRQYRMGIRTSTALGGALSAGASVAGISTISANSAVLASMGAFSSGVGIGFGVTMLLIALISSSEKQVETYTEQIDGIDTPTGPIIVLSGKLAGISDDDAMTLSADINSVISVHHAIKKAFASKSRRPGIAEILTEADAFIAGKSGYRTLEKTFHQHLENASETPNVSGWINEYFEKEIGVEKGGEASAGSKLK